MGLELSFNGYVIIVEYWNLIIDVYFMPIRSNAVVRRTVFINSSFRGCC
jgi:hypothetical protein